jgi:hypothetical protein
MSTAEVESIKVQNQFIIAEINGLKAKIEDASAKSFILSNELTDINDKVDSAIKYIYNDTKTGRKGLVQAFDELLETVTEINNREVTKEAVKKGQMAVYGAIGAAILLVIKSLIPFIAKLF